ncbi:MAG TPA: hypothetical protein VJA19_21335 [Pseudomonas sp.]|nr:hypothetical protein [Pseudomonas sp.]
MSKTFLSIIGATVLAMVISTSVTGCSGLFDKIADTLLANEVRFDDREAPRTAYVISASADEVQLVGGQGNGLSCSLPPGAQALAFSRGDKQAPIALQMRQACAFHDYCYRHGNATYGYSQADCDFMLQQQAFRLCKFINPQETVGTCETNARKVTLGVRLGGFGSFKHARTLEDEKASTFLEFDPYPVGANIYRVVRIADAPRQWVRDGLLPKAAYHFDIRPSGSLVHVLGWKPDGGMVCDGFELPGSYDAINGPPMVVRDASNGDDWFVWWKRGKLTATNGRFALLPPGRATRQDWGTAGGGFKTHEQDGQCERKALWSNHDDAPAPEPLAFVTQDVDHDFSELHPTNGADTPGLVRLMGLSTHSCNSKDFSPCLVDVVFDTALRGFRKVPKSPTLYRAIERNCSNAGPDGQPRDSCDRYRNYVGAPFVVAHESQPSLIWMRRGAGNGDGYETAATVRRYSIGKTRADPAIDLGERVLTAFPETLEPAFITNATSASPTFMSLVAGKDGFQLHTQTAAQKGGQSSSATLACLGNAHTSWLQRPSFLVQDPQDAGRSYIVFSRVRLNDEQNKAFAQAAVLEVAVATLANGACFGVQESSFPKFFDGFAAADEQAAAVALAVAVAAGKGPGDAGIDLAKEAIGPYAERVRGGQMVLADVTGDSVPDLLQIALMPSAPFFRAGLLVGSIDASGLRFRKGKGSE